MRTLFILGCLFCSIPTFTQVSYYIGTAGNDSNLGTTESNPLATFDYALNLAQHGDTIFVLPGIYSNLTYGNIDIWKNETTFKINNKHGVSEDYLVIKPLYPGTVVLHGDGSYIFQIRNSSFIRVEGFEIEGEVENIPLSLALQYQFTYKDANGIVQERVPPGTPASTIETMTFPILNNITRPYYFSTMGILVQGSHHIDISNNTVHHMPGTGIRAFESDYVSINKNNVHNNSRRSSIGNHGLVIHSALSNDSTDTFKIHIIQNTVHSNYNEVYSWSENKTFITPHIDEGKGISLQKNTYNNGWTHGWFYIANNVCYNNGFSGIHLNEGVRARIVNNTCVNNSFTGNGNNLGISSQTADSIEIFNNIIVSPDWGFALNHPNTNNLIIQRNIIQGIISSEADLIDLETIFVDPLLSDVLYNDFSLTSTSPAIDQALATVAPETDFLNQLRVSPDIGAFEFQSSSVLNQSLFRPLLVFPTVSSNEITISGAHLNSTFLINELTGKNVLAGQIEYENQIIDVSKLNNGLYTIRCEEQAGYFFKF